MEILVIVSVLTLGYALLVVAFPRFAGGQPAPPDIWPYRLRKPLSDSERTLHANLAGMLPECQVLVHVPLVRVLQVDTRSDRHEWLARIDRLAVDFLVCDPDGNAILAVDVEHDAVLTQPQRHAAEVKTRALRDAGIPLRRFGPDAPLNRAEVRGLALKEDLAAAGA